MTSELIIPNRDWITDAWDVCYHAGVLVLSRRRDPANQRKVQLFHHTAASRRNVTLSQWQDCVRSHGVDRAAETFWRISVKD